MEFKEIENFAAAVRSALSDLSADQVAHLTEDLEANMKASVDDGASLPDVDIYVKELLAGAGIDFGESVERTNLITRIVAVIRPLLSWFLGLDVGLRLLLGVGVFIALTILTTDDWTIAIVVGVVAAVAVARRPQTGAGRRRRMLAASVPIGLIVVCLASFIVPNENSGPWDGYLFCPREAMVENRRVSLPSPDVPNLVGKTLSVAEAEARLWWTGQVELEPTNPEVFALQEGPRPLEDGFVVIKQGEPELSDSVCQLAVVIPVVLSTPGETPTVVEPGQIPGDTTTTTLGRNVDGGDPSSITTTSAPRRQSPGTSSTPPSLP
ncbi:MAG: hypothetical protein RI900_3173 [Actinomycetota bacterium]